MHASRPFVLLLCAVSWPGSATAMQIAAPSAEQAVERQRAEIRDIVSRPCRSAGDENAILVCGSPLPRSTAANAYGYDPSRRFVAPERGPWFEMRRGRVSLSCCAISNANGSGSGLSLRVSF